MDAPRLKSGRSGIQSSFSPSSWLLRAAHAAHPTLLIAGKKNPLCVVKFVVSPAMTARGSLGKSVKGTQILQSLVVSPRISAFGYARLLLAKVLRGFGTQTAIYEDEHYSSSQATKPITTPTTPTNKLLIILRIASERFSK